jgi:uncharacterized membrane protein
MHSASPSDIRGSTLRLAVAAVIVGLAIPLLPLFGDQSPEFIFLAQALVAIANPLLPRVVDQRLGGGGRDLVLEA